MHLNIVFYEELEDYNLIEALYPIEGNTYCYEMPLFYTAYDNFNEDNNHLYIVNSDNMPSTLTLNPGNGIICFGNLPESIRNLKAAIIAYEKKGDFLEFGNAVLRIYEKYLRLDQMLQSSLNKSKGLQDLVQLISVYFKNEVIIMTAYYQVIACSNPINKLLQISDLPQTDKDGYIPLELLNYFKNDTLYYEVEKEQAPFIYPAGGAFPCNVLCQNVLIQGEFICRIVVSEIESPLRRTDFILLNYFTTYILNLFEITNYRDINKIPNSFIQVIEQLLNGHSISASKLNQSLNILNWSNKMDYLCAIIQPSEKDYKNKTLTYHCQEIIHEFPGIITLEYQEKIFCLINISRYYKTESEFTSKFIYYLREANFRTGMSNIFQDLTELRFFHQQAEIALKIGSLYHPTLWYYRYSEQLIPYMYYQMTRELDFSHLCIKELQTLIEYDTQNNGVYVLTLETYFKNHMNAVKTAKDLYIQRGTLNFRLKRIKQLTGFDFSDYKKTLTMQLFLGLKECHDQIF